MGHNHEPNNLGEAEKIIAHFTSKPRGAHIQTRPRKTQMENSKGVQSQNISLS